MQSGDFKDSTLILVGHGSTLNAESADPTFQHAEKLRNSGMFGQVLEAFWKQEPSVAGVLRGAFCPRIFIVPLFISSGYFTEEVIPRELGFPKGAHSPFLGELRRGALTVHYCGPVGTHESMQDVILARAQDVVQRHPFPRAPEPRETALFIAGHGTVLNENSRRAIEFQMELIRKRNHFAEVHAIFMEEEPRIGSCFTMASNRHIVIVPFFISDGLHSYEDIPVMLGEPERVVRERLRQMQPTWRNPTERAGKLIWYSPSVGTEPKIARVILERVRQAAERREMNEARA